MIATSILLIGGNANSALINIDLTADITSAQNYGGLTAFTDTITADVWIDDTDLTGTGVEQILFTGISYFDITAGTLLFDESMDSGSNASITFTNGFLSDFNFGAIFDVSSAPEDFNSTGTSITASRTYRSKGQDINVSLFAEWRVAELPITAVPVPAAVWLFGSGLIGLAGVARRKAA